MITALDDTDAAAMVWMPAHTKATDVGKAFLGDGSRLTAEDRMANEEADKLAKAAVEAHRVPKQLRAQIKQRNELVEATARWVAWATWAAGNQTVEPLRDTDASRAAALAASRARKRERLARPSSLGGHTLRHHEGA